MTNLAIAQLLVIGALGVCLIALAVVDDISHRAGTHTRTWRYP